MKTKTRRKLQNGLFGALVFFFIASTYLIYSPILQGGTSASPAPALNAIPADQLNQTLPESQPTAPAADQAAPAVIENDGSQANAPVTGAGGNGNSLQGAPAQ